MLYTDEMLLQVERPARYIGSELNRVTKRAEDAAIRFAFCFPDTYEIGMSCLGLQILYYFLNRRADTLCERVFAPWGDMERLMREKNFPLVTVDSYEEVKAFDFVGFTLQYELGYTNLLNMLDLSGIPLLSANRSEDDPIVVAGGPCAYNPEPLADFVDFFYIGEGEGETILDDILDLYKANKAQGGTRADFLARLLSVKGVYVPRFYDVTYRVDSTIATFTPNHPDAPVVVEKVIVEDLDKSFFPTEQLVPLVETVHDRATVEVFRGCIRGCRFCQAGYVYRPVREKTHETLLGQAEKLIAASGHDEVSLVSLSTGDYREFKPLAEGLLQAFNGCGVNISLPSLRIDAFNLDLMAKVQEVRRSSLTFAPEAGSQRMRNVINKNLTEQEILDGCTLAFTGGWNRVKLYFMLGLPCEEDEDINGIGKLADAIADKFYTLPLEKRPRPVSISVSASCFVPKPFTAFQWAAQDTMEEFERKQKLLKQSSRRTKQVRISYHNADVSVLEGVMARGDRRVGKAILRAWELGARFDGWSELFNWKIWKQACADAGVDMDFYAARKRAYDEILPWDFISVGVDKPFLIREMERAEKAATTPDCRTACANCGARRFGGGVCFE